MTKKQLYVLLNCSRFVGCFTSTDRIVAAQQIIMTILQLQSEFKKLNK